MSWYRGKAGSDAALASVPPARCGSDMISITAVSIQGGRRRVWSGISPADGRDWLRCVRDSPNWPSESALIPDSQGDPHFKAAPQSINGWIIRFIFIQGENQLVATFESQETKIFNRFMLFMLNVVLLEGKWICSIHPNNRITKNIWALAKLVTYSQY